jgi:hypothetical protein
MLHVTNGDSAARKLAAAGLGGAVLPWRDVLHEGPVPAGPDPAGLNAVRARFLAEVGWATYEEAFGYFQARDATLTTAAAGAEEIVLWFEHDLYDQLQLAQILAMLDAAPRLPRVSLICIDAFPGVTPFHGLGQLQPADFAMLFPSRIPVSEGAPALGRAAWTAFREPDPTALDALLAADTTALPFLAAAFRRWREEFPAPGDGLGRNERAILRAVAAGAQRPPEIFHAVQGQEAAPYLGDSSCWRQIADLAGGPVALLVARDPADAGPFTDRRFELSAAGRAVLAGDADAVALRGLDRWLGGAHLEAPARVWRWDAVAHRLVLDAPIN